MEKKKKEIYVCVLISPNDKAVLCTFFFLSVSVETAKMQGTKEQSQWPQKKQEQSVLVIIHENGQVPAPVLRHKSQVMSGLHGVFPGR